MKLGDIDDYQEDRHGGLSLRVMDGLGVTIVASLFIPDVPQFK